MEIVVRRGDRETIDQSNLSPKQKPGYLNLKIKLKLDSLFNQSVNHQLIEDAVNCIDLYPFTKIENNDQRLLLLNLIKYQFMIRGVDISGYVENELMKIL